MSAPDELLRVEDLRAGYGQTEVLHGISLAVARQEIVLVIGHNGAGKSTIPRALLGLLPDVSGSVRFDGAEISGLKTADRVRRGIALVVQGQGIFRTFTVQDNLLAAAFTLKPAEREAGLRYVYELFPLLVERRAATAGLLSGGQQRMLSLAMALITRPRLLLVDEPSIGLSPALVKEVIGEIAALRERQGLGVLLVEQNVRVGLEVADRVYVLKAGDVIHQDSAAALRARPSLWDLF